MQDQALDAAAICAQFEEACSDFQVPATRVAAEAILSSFRQIPKVLPVCQYILEHATSPMVQFQIALAIGDIAVRDYTLYSPLDVIQLKNYMIDYCLKNVNLMKYVRDQLLSGAALLTKRSLFDVSDQDKEAILANFKHLISIDEHNAVVGVALASCLVDQFSNSKSSTVGLSWEFHHKCKLFFESHVLFPLLEQSVSKLHGFVSHTSVLPTPVPPLLAELIALMERVLQWDFESTNETQVLPGSFAKPTAENDDFDRSDGANAMNKTYTVFPKSWQPFIANVDVQWLFFMTYNLVAADPVLSHRCRQCLVQLSGFTMEFFGDDGNTAKLYANAMIHGLLQMMNDIQAAGTDPDLLSESGPHVLCTIQMIRRLFENLPLHVICSVPEFFQFISDVGKVTVTCIRGAAVNIDEDWISEASDECLQTWVTLANIVQPLDGGRGGSDPRAGLSQLDIDNLTQFIRNVSLQIVETFIETQLEQTKRSLIEDDDEEDINGGFKDWDTFADRLTCIGILGRLDPHKCLLHLENLLNDRFSRLKDYFTSQAENSDQYLLFLHEHIHWILLIVAHILADGGKGEQPLIPDSLMHLSGSQPLEQDQVVNISNLVLQIFHFLSSFSANTVEASNCSPRVAETLFWFLDRWSKSYLLVNENDYGYMSPNIARAFGSPGPSDGQGLHIVDFFIDQIKANFILWNADPDVLLMIIKWLNTCSTSSNLKNGFLQSSKFPDLVQFVTTNLEQLPEIVHNSLIQTVTTIASGANDVRVRDDYLGLIFGMIEKHFGAVLHHPEFLQNCQRVDMMNSVMDALEMFDGLALASQFNNTQSIFNFTSRFFESFLQLMNLYKNVMEVQLLVLQLMADLAGRLEFSKLEPGQKHTLLQVVIETIKVYGANNQGVMRLHSQEEEADRPYADLATVVTLLTNLMASEFEDFNRTESPDFSLPGAADVADAVFFGANVIIPMIDLKMLKIPSLCQQYIKLISHLIEFFPDKLSTLPQDLLNNLMASLEFGINHDIVDVSILALQALAPLALWAHNQQLVNHSIEFLKPALTRFQEQLVNILLFQNLDSSVIDAASEALLALICCQRDTYFQMVNQIISQQPNDTQPRILHAFEQLERATPRELRGVLRPGRNSGEFKDALMAFLINVRAVLRIK